MKKSIIFCLCIAVVALFSACKDPEGVFNPSKKIQKVYNVNDEGVKDLSEVWNWNGNVLTSIDCIDDTYPYTVYFNYDSKNRLVSMDEAGAHSEFIYDGKYIQKIEGSYEGTVVSTMEFVHKNGKIVEMRLDDLLYMTDKAQLLNPMRFVIPEACAAVQNAIEKCSKEAKGDDQIVIKLNWKGDNVTSMELNFTSWGVPVTETVELTFDKKNNPTYGLFATLGSDVAVNLFLNKNNPLSVKYLYMGQALGGADFTYEYEGNYPTKVTCKTVEGGEVDVETVIYEY